MASVPEDYKGNISYLAAKGVISETDTWNRLLSGTDPIPYAGRLEFLIPKTVQYVTGKTYDYNTSCNYLKDIGVINTPDYWLLEDIKLTDAQKTEILNDYCQNLTDDEKNKAVNDALEAKKKRGLTDEEKEKYFNQELAWRQSKYKSINDLDQYLKDEAKQNLLNYKKDKATRTNSFYFDGNSQDDVWSEDEVWNIYLWKYPQANPGFLSIDEKKKAITSFGNTATDDELTNEYTWTLSQVTTTLTDADKDYIANAWTNKLTDEEKDQAINDALWAKRNEYNNGNISSIPADKQAEILNKALQDSKYASYSQKTYSVTNVRFLIAQIRDRFEILFESDGLTYFYNEGYILDYNGWKQLLGTDTVPFESHVKYLIPRLAQAISDKLEEYYTFSIGNYDEAVEYLAKKGCMNTPSYWKIGTVSQFPESKWVEQLIDNAYKVCINGKLDHASRNPNKNDYYVNKLFEWGIINTPDYWYSHIDVGTQANTDYTKYLIIRMAGALGCNTDNYGDCLAYLSNTKGSDGVVLINTPSYWEEGNPSSGLTARGYADGDYVHMLMKRFVNFFEANFTKYMSRLGLSEDGFNIKDIHKALGIYVPTYQVLKEFDYYNRWKVTDYVDRFMGGRGYVFFSKPKLNLSTSNVNMDQFFLNMVSTLQGRTILQNLTYDTSDLDPIPLSRRGIIKLLTNRATNFDTQDTSIRQDVTVETWKGYKYSLPGSEADSITNGSFSITFDEGPDMAVTLLHKAWIDYIIGVRYGKYIPSEAARLQRYIDYCTSVYYFLVGEDGRTIKYFCKYTGVYPLNVPYSAFSWQAGSSDSRKLSIQYAFSFKEDMNPTIIEEFNRIFNASDKVEDDITNQTWMSNVGIYRQFSSGANSDGSTNKRSLYINETGSSRYFFDNTAKLIFSGSSVYDK